MKTPDDCNSMQLAASLKEFMPADDGPATPKEDLGLSREELLELNAKLLADNAGLLGKVEKLNKANSDLKNALKESAQRFRVKIESTLHPDDDFGNLELGDVIDVRALQSLVDDFYELTRMPMSLTDVNGNVLVGVGWQAICTEFHRINPNTCRNCIESDVQLSAGVPPGDFKIYKCKNNMWDVATPIMLNEKRLGNLFMGQFFFDDESLDYELFRSQARQYGFDENAYIAALEAVPRLSRKDLNTCMSFFMKLAGVLSKLSYSNLKLALSIFEYDELMLSLNQSEQRLRMFIEHAPASLAMFDLDMRYLSVSRRWLSDFSLGDRDLFGLSHYDIFPEITAEWREAHRRGLGGEVQRSEGDRFERADGSVHWKRWEIRPWYDSEGTIGGIVIFSEDITERKRAEEALRESETRYHNLFENMLEGFAYCRMLFDEHDQPADFVYLDVNTAFGRLTGLEGVTGRKVTEVIPGIKEAHPELFEIYGRVAQTGQTEKFEIEVLPIGIWFSISAYSPEKGYFVAVFDNISERKRAESALRESERLYRAIGESIDYGIWTCAPDGRCTYASESFLRMVGMTQEQCSNFGWGDVLHPDDAENTIAAWKECVRTEGVWDVEHRFRGVDGKWHPVLARGVPVRNERGELICWAGINLDINRMKQVEDELRTSEEKFSTMLQNVPIAIALATSPDGALYNVNPAWLELTGINRKEDAIGKTSLELGLIADAAQRQSLLSEFRQNGFVRNAEMTFCTRKGVQRTVLVNLDRVEIAGRTFILSTMEEITERKRAEEELLHKNLKLESMAIELSLAEERERDRIAGELHDQVGQRLIFGKMKLGALASQLHDDECINDVEELDRIIDLSIQDIRSLTFQLRPPILASAGLEAALHWLGEEFHEKYGLLLTYSDDGQQKPMRYEARSTVFQAAREMLLNTVKHACATHIGIKIRRELDMLQVCLSDNGCGFDIAEARIKKSRSGGFGLINVQRRIEHLGGSIFVESQPGNGTCVTIMAPLETPQ